MPIAIDYATRTYQQYARSLLKEPVYGNNELKPEQVFFERSGFKTMKREPGFFTSKGQENIEFGEFVYKTHDYLSTNIEGPWHLLSGWSQHFIQTLSVHIERFDQRDIFEKSKYGVYMNRRDYKTPGNDAKKMNQEKQEEITALGIIKGIIPPYSFNEDLKTWMAEYPAVKFEDAIIGNVSHCIVQPQLPQVDQSFRENFVDSGFYQSYGENAYIRKEGSPRLDNDLLSKWMKNNTAITYIHGGASTDPQYHRLDFRYPEIEEKFKETWSKHFQYDENENHYFCGYHGWPALPERDVPQDLVDYLHGRGSDPFLKP